MPNFFDILFLDNSERGNKMNERLKAIRKKLSLSQEAFGKKLGVTGAGISKIESGDRNLTEQMVLAICREFNVREEWLRNGSGEMFLNLTEDEFAKAAATLSNDTFIRNLIVEYWKLDEGSRQLFKNFIQKLSEGIQKQECTSSIVRKEKTSEELEEGNKRTSASVDFSHLTIDEKVALYRQELEIEARATAKSEVS